jgi:hypothetical protein
MPRKKNNKKAIKTDFGLPEIWDFVPEHSSWKGEIILDTR